MHIAKMEVERKIGALKPKDAIKNPENIKPIVLVVCSPMNSRPMSVLYD